MNIQHLKLLTHELELLHEFYTKTLSLRLLHQSNDEFTFQSGRSQLTFARTEHSGEHPFYHFAFDVPGDQLEESMEWLLTRGVSLQQLPNGTCKEYSAAWNAASVYFLDPAGNIVEFIARHNLQHSDSPAFSSGSLIGISEIGLVIEDVPAVKNLIQSKLAVEGYKSSYSNFAAVGDEDGLFILAASGRVWFGSDKQYGFTGPCAVDVCDGNTRSLSI